MKPLIESVESGARNILKPAAGISGKQRGASVFLPGAIFVLGLSLLLYGEPACAQEEGTDDAGSAASAAGGTLEHKVDSQAGRFTYQVPLVVPPGRQGAEPQLMLGYGSGSGNGWCGVGWGLEVGYIQRSVKYGVPIKWSAGSAMPLKEYDDTKSFTAVVGGVSSTLVLVSPENQDPQEYRTEVETAFLKFKYYKSTNYWQIVDKSGNSFFFGQTQASRMENTNSGWTPAAAKSTFRWGMDRVLDVNGNETVLTYTKDGGYLYLSNISYDGNVNGSLSRTHTVDFILTNRTDTGVAFNTGFRLETHKLLSEVQMKVSGSPVRRYALNYTNSASTLRSLLRSVTQYGSDFTNPLPAVKFTYQAQQFEFAPDTDWLGVTNNRVNDDEWNAVRVGDGDNNTTVTFADMDGDGLTDRVMRKAYSSYTYFDVQRNTGSGFVPGTTYMWSPVNSHDPTDVNPASPVGVASNGRTDSDLVDMNGDSLPDRVRKRADNPYTNIWVQINNGLPGTNAFSNTNLWPITAEQGSGNVDYRSLRDPKNMDLLDMNGDGLPDRVMRQLNAPYNRFKVQLNQGTNFSDLVDWYPVYGQDPFSSVSFVSGDFDTAYPLYTLCSKLNTPTTALATYLRTLLTATTLSQIGSYYSNYPFASVNPLAGNLATDLNTIISNGPLYDSNRFAPFMPFSQATRDFMDAQPVGLDLARLNRKLLNEAYTEVSGIGNVSDADWRTLAQQDHATKAMLIDINGDGLPDRVMRKTDTPYTNWVVQYNNGAGFEAPENWGGISPGNNDKGANSPVGSDSSHTWSTLIDINGDGLPDRVKRTPDSPYTNWVVQFNTGSGFATSVTWAGVDGQGNPTDRKWNNISSVDGDHDTFVDFFDINGDGLPDRVMREENHTYDKFIVQLNKGPFPDLLILVSNDMGGAVSAGYVSSVTWKNRDKDWTTDPWNEGARGLLPYSIQTVNRTVVYDGFGNSNETTYAYQGGYQNAAKKEFRGFQRVEERDSYGLKTVTYFHQGGGGYNGSANGEYQDQEGKQGIPYLVENYDTNNVLLRRTLNKVEVAEINPGERFPYISQTVKIDYADGTHYRASAEQVIYDSTTGNVRTNLNLGEVAAVNLSTHGITDLDSSDNIRIETTYKTFAGNSYITGKPDVITISKADLSQPRKIRKSYDTRGNSTMSESWLASGSRWITNRQTQYDTMGNPWKTIDSANVATEITYDSTYKQYPVMTKVAPGTSLEMAGLTLFDPRCGQVLMSTNHLSVVTRTDYDVFFRPIATYVNQQTNAEAALWRTRTDYAFNGIAGTACNNCIHTRAYDPNDTTNGIETFSYFDGLGRVIQTRVESETNNVFRCSDSYYEDDGKNDFTPVPYFGSGTAYVAKTDARLGAFTEYDAAGRPAKTTPAAQATYNANRRRTGSVTLTGGDADAPVGPTMTFYGEGTNPWVATVNDPEITNKFTKTYSDGFGRVTSLVEITPNLGSVSTRFYYNFSGELTNITDNANNKTYIYYDSLGRKTSMVDPDMGTWTYSYDDAGRMVDQYDAKNQRTHFAYESTLGRLRTKQIYDSASALKRTVTYNYDTPVKSGFTVQRSQLASVTETSAACNCTADERYWSYDYKGRVIKEGVYSSAFGTWVTTNRYNEADQLVELSYPNDVARLSYTYQNGVLKKIQSLKGTGATSETFYELASVNELGRPVSYLTHNGQVTNAHEFFANSKRLKTVSAVKGATAILNKTYSFDRMANVKSITDNISGHTNTASGTIQNLQYDDFHRLTGLTDASTSRSYQYDLLGNITSNGDGISGTYSYGSKPHAVTTVGSRSYQYDANGSMTNRNGQTLVYDQQNRLVQVTNGTVNVHFGYAYDGGRLWKYNKNTDKYTCFVSPLFEYRESDTAGLCYVFAAGQRIAAFRPTTDTYILAGMPVPWYEPLLAFFRGAGEEVNRGFNWACSPRHIQATAASVTIAFSLLLLLAGRYRSELL